MKVLRDNQLVDMDPEEEAAFLAERAERTRVTPAMVKAEAQRRIYARYPQWRQANMTARGVELQDIWRTGGVWTAQELAEANALKVAWAWVRSVRTASDQIEALSPIPADFRDDARWPA